jgi:predicted nuclease of restriction endonuclease-like (RecB) superfamily
MENLNYLSAVGDIKKAILKSRITAATLVNKELLVLYFFIGKYVSANTRNKNWGNGGIDKISNLLQQELNGLRGFSATNIKNMRFFYEEWQFLETLFLKHSTVELFDNQENTIRQLPTDELEIINRQMASDDLSLIRQMASAELENKFFRVGFSHHVSIIKKIEALENRVFYLEKSVSESWSYETLKHHLKNELHLKIGKLTHNFDQTISLNNFKQKALMVFKDEMLLDFINVEDPDDEPNERVLEQEIVLNIKKFIMALGSDFSFIGNQYRLIIEDEEYFIDLLFYNRKIQSLVAIELKKGKFKAEYVGKMNLYLSALDEYMKQPHENPSIGIILCKEKNNKIVEFAFRDTTKPMGVVTYKTYKDLPEQYKNVLPNIADLKRLME